MQRRRRRSPRTAACTTAVTFLWLLILVPTARADLVWHLKNSHSGGWADVSFTYGQNGDTPVVGDWNGDGYDTPGVVRGGNLWLLRDSNTTGPYDRGYSYGNPTGMVPIAGDWNGDNWDTPGMYADGVFYLNDTHSGGYSNRDFRFAPAGVPHRPLFGDFNNDGVDTTGVFRDGRWWLQNVHSIYTQVYFEYGNPPHIPLMGDWDGDGIDTHGVYDWGNATFYLRNTNTTGPTDIAIRYGDFGDIPVVGDWNNDGIDTIGAVKVDPYPSSTYYGGGDGITTDAEEASLGYALATRSDFQRVWNELSPQDKVTMIYAADPHFAAWGPRIDRAGPSAPPSLDLEYQNGATRQGDFAWEPSDDPAIDADTPGTGIGDRSEFRVRRQGSSWGSWRAADGSGMTLEYVDVGDLFDFQVRDYDRAGNVGAIRSETITIDPPEARAAVPWAPILACVRFCAPVAGALGRWTGVIHTSTRVIAISRVTQPYYVTAWNAARGASRSAASSTLRGAMRTAGRGPGRGLEAHHIIAWSHRYARFAQQVASRCGIEPNDAANGVYLNKDLHKRAKTKAYYENINRLLWDYAIDCGTPGYTGGIGKPHLKEFLQEIGAELAAGRFPG